MKVLFLYPDFPLRLYALRVNDRRDLVVLFGGGLKSGRTNQQSADLHLKWIEACQFARRIEDALRNGEIIVDWGKRLIRGPDGEDIVYL